MKLMIIGLGLIGGSIAKKIKEVCPESIICGIDPDEATCRKALSDGVIDKSYPCFSQDDTDYDIVLVAVPPHITAKTILKIAPFFGQETVFTDVCSVKEQLEQELSRENINYVGGHPMAGTEQKGYDGSYAHLFENAYYILTKDHPKMKRFAELLGATPIVMDAKTHDKTVGAISHVPHVISAALVNLAAQNETQDKKLTKVAAGGFRDITRISASSEDLWQSIVSANKAEVLSLLEQYDIILNQFRHTLLSDDTDGLKAFFRSAREFRGQLEENREELQPKYFDIYISVKDRVGVIRDIAQILTEENISIKNIGVLKSREHIGGTLQLSVYSKEDYQKATELLKKQNFEIVKR
ncbi:MAG: prephenate dehydrogenase [Clostridia bacterium]|nr:prephenate dehydrogenase [Clostridia bacterium]